MAVSCHQGVTLLIALSSGCLDVVGNLCLQCFGKHPSRSGTGKIVEVEQALLAVLAAPMYSVHIGVFFPLVRQRQLFLTAHGEGTPHAL